MRKKGLARRIYDEIRTNGKALYSLFDSGARNTYITREAALKLGANSQKLRHVFKTGLGGKKRLVREYVGVEGTLHGLPLHVQAYIVDKLGADEAGRPLELLFGILAMEQWGVELDLQNKRLDLRYFTKEFAEFQQMP